MITVLASFILSYTTLQKFPLSFHHTLYENIIIYSNAVSYTHLDVYKRQVQARPMVKKKKKEKKNIIKKPWRLEKFYRL